MQKISESLSPVITAVERIHTPLQEWADMYKNTYTPIQNMALGAQLPETISVSANICQLAAAFADNPFLKEPQIMQGINKILPSLQDIISSNISQAFENCPSFPSDQLIAILEPLFVDADDIEPSEPDYVIVNERPIKELCVPDTLFIPLGDFRIKIKTDLFVNILFGIFGFVLSIVLSIVSSSNVDSSASNADSIMNQVSDWPVRIIDSLLDSIDTLSSSQAEAIEAFQTAFEAQARTAEAQEKAAEAQIKAAESQERAAEAQIKAAESQERAAEAQIKASEAIRQAADNVTESEHTKPDK